MKCLLVCTFLALFIALKAQYVTNEKDCKCWENFKPEKLDLVNVYYCRGEKNRRIFGCGEEKPPICKCDKDGKEIELDLGETNCLTVDPKNGRWCKNQKEFLQYFKKHPEHAIIN